MTAPVAVLFAGTGSGTPDDEATEDVFTSVPSADASTTPVAVNVELPPCTSVTNAEIAPAPFEVAHADPAAATQVQVTPVSAAGNVLVTVASATGAGPVLVATIVQVSAAPGAMVVEPGVLVTARSASRIGVISTASVSLAEFGSAGALACSAATFVTTPG